MQEAIALIQESIDKKIGLSERINELVKTYSKDPGIEPKPDLSPSNS